MKIEISDSLILWGIIGMLAFTGCTYTAPIARDYRVNKVERQVPETIVYERPQQPVVVQQPVYTAPVVRPRYRYDFGTTIFVEGGYNYGFGFGGMPPHRPEYGRPIIPHIRIEPEYEHGGRGHGGAPHDGGRGEHGRGFEPHQGGDSGFEPDQGGSSGGRIIFNGGIGPNEAARYNDGLTAGERLGVTVKKGSSGKMPNPTAGSLVRNTIKGYENQVQTYNWDNTDPTTRNVGNTTTSRTTRTNVGNTTSGQRNGQGLGTTLKKSSRKYADPLLIVEGVQVSTPEQQVRSLLNLNIKAKHNNAMDAVIYGVNENVR